jgi:hypothetical protein
MRLSWPEIRANAHRFSEEWKGKGYEKGQTQSFYDEFFAIFGVPRKQVAVYEQRVRALDPARTSGFIDLFWPGTLIVEQKSSGRDLTRALTQALDYYDWLPEAQRPRYMMVCDFQRFELVDLETRREWRFPLADLKKHVEAFGFILGVQPRIFRNQSPVNRKASELMGRLHQALADDGYTGHNLERLLVRLLFILFADDTGIFQRKDQFLVFLEQRTSADGRDLGRWLGELFQVLDTPLDRRQSSLDADLAEFPYINGDLFRERIDLPTFDNAMRDMLLDASMFNWGEVSPAIFGSLFESVIDKVTRRKQGAHYTPEEAIQKVIGPLFLDDLRSEFERVKLLKSGRERAFRSFQGRLGALRFLDPACGAGNFLVVAYRELRELERDVIRELRTIEGTVQQVMDVAALSKMNVHQFHGIEIDEFPSQIAQVALWMTDHIANTRLGEDFGKPYARIPLVTAPNIRHADALELDWNEVLPAEQCSYVLGNPPFVGSKYQTVEQRHQVRQLARLPGSGGTLDYVAAWFIKGARYVANSDARIGFVSTNSITQGEQVAQLWPTLFREGVEIAFAHRTFVWPGRAAVHCVIVGLSPGMNEPAAKRLFTYADPKGEPAETRHSALTAYLFDASEADRHLVVKEESRPINGAPSLVVGSKPVDGGYLIFTPNELASAREQCGLIDRFIRPFIGAEEFLNGGRRHILALHDVAPGELRHCEPAMQRLRMVRQWRLGEIDRKPLTVGPARAGNTARELAAEPSRYHVTVLPDRPYLVVPENGSESREYVPAGWLAPPIIPSSLIRVAVDARLWHFALIVSRMHMAWLNHIGGKLKSDPRYSISLVYNTFPHPESTPEQSSHIEELAQAVLDARALQKNASSTLADLYHPDSPVPELRRAHRALDEAVDRLYRRQPFASDRERVEHLFTLYQRLAEPLQNEGVRQNRRVARRRASA